MAPVSQQEYTKLLTDIIHKQMVVFGPTATLVKAKAIKGLHVSDTGQVTGLEGNPQEITRLFLESLLELSEFSVRKSIEPILASYAGMSFVELGIPDKNQSVAAQNQPPQTQTPSPPTPQ